MNNEEAYIIELSIIHSIIDSICALNNEAIIGDLAIVASERTEKLIRRWEHDKNKTSISTDQDRK